MATAKKPVETKARVLVEGNFGKPDDVVVIPADQLDIALASGQVDISPEAVAYAEALIAPAPVAEPAPAPVADAPVAE